MWVVNPQALAGCALGKVIVIGTNDSNKTQRRTLDLFILEQG
jgi:hypothetical protein